MIHLLTTQGLDAERYQIPSASIGNFRAIIRSIVGGRVFVVSNKFKTDIFYESPTDKHLTIIKLWMLYLRRTMYLKDMNKIRTYSGDREVLVQFFHSLSFFSGNKMLFKGYLRSFRKAFYSDPRNGLAKKVIECDRYVIKHHVSKGLKSREVLFIADGKRNRYTLKKPSITSGFWTYFMN